MNNGKTFYNIEDIMGIPTIVFDYDQVTTKGNLPFFKVKSTVVMIDKEPTKLKDHYAFKFLCLH